MMPEPEKEGARWEGWMREVGNCDLTSPWSPCSGILCRGSYQHMRCDSLLATRIDQSHPFLSVTELSLFLCPLRRPILPPILTPTHPNIWSSPASFHLPPPHTFILQFAVEVAARREDFGFVRQPGRTETEDVWPWSILVPFFQQDMRERVS